MYTPTTDFPQAFTGRPLDADTGLYDYRARWYDPAVGRFVSEDRSGFAGGDANLYRYAGNSPVIYVDPSGLSYGGVSGRSRDRGLFDRIRDGFVRADQFGGQLITAAFTGEWINPKFTSASDYLKGFGLDLGRSFADGRASDSAQSTMVAFADSGADLLLALINGGRRATYSLLDTIPGVDVFWTDWERPGRLSDYLSPYYGHEQEWNVGQVFGHKMARVEAGVAALWGTVELMVGLPGLARTAFQGGSGLGLGGIGGEGALTLAPVATGDIMGLGAVGVGGVAGVGALWETGAFEPLIDWVYMSAPEGASPGGGGQTSKLPSDGLPRIKQSDFGPKIEDAVPRNGVPRSWSKTDIEGAISDYRDSIATRKVEQRAFELAGRGSETERLAHARRISQEEAFLRSLEKALENRR